ncbi:oxidoreductase [Spirochaetia bacterium]|nr:oxidoreductase [Spirochaetia bacterium]
MSRDIETRRYKDSNEYISLLGFGGLRLPLEDNKQEIDKIKLQEMVDYAMYHGVNYFDTAYYYHGGKSEIYIGDALSKYPRDSFNLATKMPLGKEKGGIESEDDVERIFQTQLKKCKVDYFDFYLIHNINKDSWKLARKYSVYDLLKEKQRQGLIRHLGFSFHDRPELLDEVVTTYNWDFVQIQLNYLDWEFQNAKGQYQILKDKCIPITVMEPVRGGMLAALCEKSIKLLKDANHDASAASWAIRYAASLPEVLTVLSGMTNIIQVKDNVQTMENFSPLNTDEYAVIERALTVYKKSVIIPCTACRYCIDCPVRIDIPAVLSIYNDYYHLRKHKREAINNFLFRYSVLGLDKQICHCIRCNQCAERCPQHINIPHWIEVVNKLYKITNQKNKIYYRLRKMKIFVRIYKFIKNMVKQ